MFTGKKCTRHFYLVSGISSVIILSHVSLTPNSVKVWKGYYLIRYLAEIDSVIRENQINSAMIREFYFGCDAEFALSVVCVCEISNFFFFFSLAHIRISHNMSLGAVVIMPHFKNKRMGIYCSLSWTCTLMRHRHDLFLTCPLLIHNICYLVLDQNSQKLPYM